MSPYTKWRAVTTSNTVNFPDGICDSLYCGSSGNLVVIMQNGGSVTFAGVFAGEILPIKAIRVNATDTTVTGIVALYAN